MLPKFRAFNRLLAMTVGLAGVVLASCASAQEKASASQGVSSNQTPAVKAPFKKSDGLRNLEQSIFKPFEGFSPQGSLDGVMNSGPNPTVPSAQSKRAKELMERRKDWVFMTPEEILTGKSTEELLGTQGSEKGENDTKLLSPMERYLQRLYGDPKQDGKKSPADRKEKGFGNSANPFASSDDADAQDDTMSDLPSSVRETQRKLKKADEDGLKSKPETEHKLSSFFSDVFALERPKPSPEEEQIEKDRLEAYRRSLGLAPTPTFGAKVSPLFKDENDPYRISIPPSLMDSAPKPSSLTPVPSPALPNSSLLSDPASKGFSTPGFTPALPKIDPPKSSLPPPPTFTAPRRAF